jgi:hypothetical protein
MYIIVKHIKKDDGTWADNSPVVVIDNYEEVMEFEYEEDAKVIQAILQNNSLSGHNTYVVNRITK